MSTRISLRWTLSLFLFWLWFFALESVHRRFLDPVFLMKISLTSTLPDIQFLLPLATHNPTWFHILFRLCNGLMDVPITTDMRLCCLSYKTCSSDTSDMLFMELDLYFSSSLPWIFGSFFLLRFWEEIFCCLFLLLMVFFRFLWSISAYF